MYGVLQAANFTYRQCYGNTEEKQPHEWVVLPFLTNNTALLPLCRQYRFIADRQLTQWCWGWLGKKVRVVLPSYSVIKIRNSFPSGSYTWFKYPQPPIIDYVYMMIIKLIFKNLVLGQMRRVRDLATIFNVWSYQWNIELLKCFLIGKAAKSSVQKTKDLPYFGATGRNVLRPR